MHGNTDTQTRSAAPLDPSLLTVASLASVCSAVVASAIGTGPVATLVAAAVAPWIVAFIAHPGPRRRRRVGAVLLLAGLVHGSRTGLARAAAYIRHPRDRAKRKVRERGAGRSLVGHSIPRRISLAGATTIAAVVISAVCLTVPELVLGAAVVADRPLTLVPISEAAAHAVPPKAAGPTLEVPRRDVRRLATGPRGARVIYNVDAHDARGAALTPHCRPRSGRLFLLGDTRVTCVARQANGLTIRRSFTVTVVPVPRSPDGRQGGQARPSGPAVVPPTTAPAGKADAAPPKLSLPGTVHAQASSPSGAIVTYVARAVDARDGKVDADCVPPSGTRFVIGRTDVHCTADDHAGNTARGVFTVVVSPPDQAADRTAPEIAVPRVVRAQATSPAGAIVSYRAVATDERDGRVAVACSPPSGSTFPVGVTRVSCVASDGAGNDATQTFRVLVVRTPDQPKPPVDRTPDPRPPSGSSGDSGGSADGDQQTTTTTSEDVDRIPPSIDEFTVTLVPRDDGVLVRYAPPNAVDDRPGPVTVTCDPLPSTLLSLDTTDVTVTCTATDGAGNTAERTATATLRGAGQP
jgi:hypothetical protein